MAQLTSVQRAELSADLQRTLSQTWEVIPLSKANLLLAITIFDLGLENAETAILGAVSAQARTWLLANVTLARFILENVAEKRREVLSG